MSALLLPSSPRKSIHIPNTHHHTSSRTLCFPLDCLFLLDCNFALPCAHCNVACWLPVPQTGEFSGSVVVFRQWWCWSVVTGVSRRLRLLTLAHYRRVSAVHRPTCVSEPGFPPYTARPVSRSLGMVSRLKFNMVVCIVYVKFEHFLYYSYSLRVTRISLGDFPLVLKKKQNITYSN